MRGNFDDDEKEQLKEDDKKERKKKMITSTIITNVTYENTRKKERDLCVINLGMMKREQVKKV